MKTNAVMMVVALISIAGVAFAGQAPPAKSSAQKKAVEKHKKEGPEAEADKEEKIELKNLPSAVRTTVEAETKNATIKGITKETEKGKTVYELESLVNGRTRDLMIDAAGKVYVVEEQLDADKAPAPVRSALEAKGTIVVLESVTEKGTTTYEGQVKTKAGKKLTMSLDAMGKPIAK